MKRIILLLVMTAMVVLVFCTAAGAAGRTYDNADLRGTYYFVSTQERMQYPPGGGEKVVEYCSGYGTATFDGSWKVVIASTDRCSIYGTLTDNVTQNYAVNADGSFLVSDPANPLNTTHCRMVDHGRTLLCDGTASLPDVLSFHVVAVKE